MWTCPNCGVINPRSLACAACNHSAPPEALRSDIPWYRESGWTSLLILLGIVIPGLILIVCFICLTGDVHYPRLKKDGTRATWSAGNKVAAILILVLQIVGIAYYLTTIHSQR